MQLFDGVIGNHAFIEGGEHSHLFVLSCYLFPVTTMIGHLKANI